MLEYLRVYVIFLTLCLQLFPLKIFKGLHFIYKPYVCPECLRVYVFILNTMSENYFLCDNYLGLISSKLSFAFIS